ncbi:hypothetical protein [Pseudomonas sp. H1h]|uniref:hypothetical protein n=1 Tax=Pseudomonas sp. H1h TaxID=1397280 RepID=UPI0004689E98|nr:hypothetical protein [Pseudomonas sp. H1h]
MDISSIPATVFVAFGVITAALLTGFFSFMNMVSAKENKVSEFRLTWVDGLRNEIAEYISAAQELVRVSKVFVAKDFHSPKEKKEIHIEWYKETRAAFSRAVENLTKIQLRLNADDIAEDAKTPEAELMKAVTAARNYSINGDLKGVLSSCNDIRSKAAPILKSTWVLVKRGEIGYRRIRRYSLFTVTIGFYAIISFGIYIGIATYNTHSKKELKLMTNTIEEHQKHNTHPLPQPQKEPVTPKLNQPQESIIK